MQDLLEKAREEAEVALNDKSAVEEELARVAAAKRDAELDLGETAKKLTEVERVAEEAGILRGRLKDSESAVVLLEQKVGDLQAKEAVMSAALESRGASVQELEDEVVELAMERDSLQGALSSAQIEGDAAAREKERMAAMLQQTGDLLAERLAECEQLKVEAAALREDKADLNQTCLMLEASLKEAARKADDLEQDAAGLRIENENLANEAAAVGQDAAEKDAIIVKLVNNSKENQAILEREAAAAEEKLKQKEVVEADFEEARRGLERMDVRYTNRVRNG